MWVLIRAWAGAAAPTSCGQPFSLTPRAWHSHQPLLSPSSGCSDIKSCPLSAPVLPSPHNPQGDMRDLCYHLWAQLKSLCPPSATSHPSHPSPRSEDSLTCLLSPAYCLSAPPPKLPGQPLFSSLPGLRVENLAGHKEDGQKFLHPSRRPAFLRPPGSLVGNRGNMGKTKPCRKRNGGREYSVSGTSPRSTAHHLLQAALPPGPQVLLTLPFWPMPCLLGGALQ